MMLPVENIKNATSQSLVSRGANKMFSRKLEFLGGKYGEENNGFSVSLKGGRKLPGQCSLLDSPG